MILTLLPLLLLASNGTAMDIRPARAESRELEQVHFTETAITSHATTYAQIIVPVDLTSIIDAANQMITIMAEWGTYLGIASNRLTRNSAMEALHDPYISHQSLIFFEQLYDLLRVQDAIEGIHIFFSEQNLDLFNHHRVKRMAGLIFAGATFAITLITGLISVSLKNNMGPDDITRAREAALRDGTVATIQNVRDIGHNNMAMGKIVKGLTEANAKQLWYPELRIRQGIKAVDRHVRVIISAIDALNAGSCPTEIFIQADLDRIFQNITAAAQKKGMLPIARRPADMVQHQCSWIKTKAGFDIVLVVPLINDETTLKVYRLKPSHIRLSGTQYLDWESLTAHHLAVRHHDPEAYRAMTKDDLQTCRKWGKRYLQCDDPSVLHILDRTAILQRGPFKDDATCLYTLFKGYTDVAAIACPMREEDSLPRVHAMGNWEFATYTPGHEEGKVSCDARNIPGEAVIMHGLQDIKVRPDCQVDSPHHSFRSSAAMFYARDDSWSRNYELPYDPRQAAKDFKIIKEEDDQKLKDIDKINNDNQKVVDKADETLAQLHKHWKEHGTGTIIGASTVIILVITAVLAVCFYRRCRLRQTGDAPIPLPQITNQAEAPLLHQLTDGIARMIQGPDHQAHFSFNK